MCLLGWGPHASSSFLGPKAGVLRTHVLRVLGCCKVLSYGGASPAKGAFSLAGQPQLCRRGLEEGHRSCHFCRRMDKLTIEEELKFSPESATWHSAVWTDYGPAPGGGFSSSSGETQNQALWPSGRWECGSLGGCIRPSRLGWQVRNGLLGNW